METTKPHTKGKVKVGAAQRKGEGKPAPGARLAAAFAAAEKFPVLMGTRARAMKVPHPGDCRRRDDLVKTVEPDAGLAISTLRFANRSGGAGSVSTIPEAIEVLKPSGVLA